MLMPKQSFADRILELDGVRGLAILLVLCTHIFKRADYLTENQILHLISAPTRIGWIGVDLFFTLSGFLITGILLRTREDSNYFKNFYVRRILRIFPLYYILVGGLLIFLPQLDTEAGARTQAFWPVYMLYQQNWLHVFRVEPSLFLVPTWSLAIEEQFYLIWPTVVYFFKPRMLIFLSIGIVLFSLLIRIIMMLMQSTFTSVFPVPEFFYYGSITRFEGLALGSLIAILFETADIWKQKMARWAWPVLIFSAGLFIWIAVLAGTDNPVSSKVTAVWGYSLIALVSGALIVLVTTQPEQSLIRRIFKTRVMAFFGKYSYAMYLIHAPFISLLLEYMWNTGRRSSIMWLSYIVISFAGTILLSLLSWNLLEKRMLALKKHFEYQPTRE
jgi:peptidoglycan/LPS O-acetylase OafA/YrhL